MILLNIIWKRFGLLAWAIALSVGLATPEAVASTGGEDEKITFEDHAQPIFRARCAACHNSDKKSGGLDLSTYTTLMEGGSSGSSIEPGDPDSSYLYSLVTHDQEPYMPPGSNKIPDAEIDMLKKWIAGGALETKSSKAKPKKKAIGAATGSSLERPAIVAMPPHLPLDPILHTPKPGCVNSLATSPWAPLVAVAAPRQVLLYNTTTLQLVGVLDFPEGQPNVLKFSRTGQLLLAGGGRNGASGRVVIWDVATGERVTEIGDEVDSVLAADISLDHSLVALGGPQKVVRVYSTADGALRYEIRKHTEWVTAIAFSPDGVLLASGDRNGGAFVWEADTGNPYLELKGHTDRITDVSWRLDSNLIATSSQDATIRTWEIENGAQVKSWSAHGGGAISVDFNRAGNLVSTGRDRVPKLWNQNGEALKQFAALSDLGTAAAFCDETARVVAGDWLGQVQVFAEADGAVVGSLSPNPRPLAQLLEESQQQLATATAAHQPIAEQHAAQLKTLTELQTALAAQVTNRQNMMAMATQLEQQVAAAQQQLQARVVEQTTWQGELDQKLKLKPELQSLSEKATAVAALSPTDAELQAAAGQLDAKLKQTDSRIGELNTALAQNTEQRGKLETELKSAGDQLATQRSQLEELGKQIAAMEQQQATLDAALKEKQVALEQAQTTLAATQAAVSRWQGEIQFVASLKQLLAERKAAEILTGERLAAQQTIEQELAAVQQRLDAAKAAVGEASTGQENVEQRLRDLKGIQ
ncbi:MAG: c-type cytochrome domain-containing protein [Planctomycetota bacterium]